MGVKLKISKRKIIGTKKEENENEKIYL